MDPKTAPPGTLPFFVDVGGKKLPGSEGANFGKVYFSPDGKHYAIPITTRANSQFMLIDGKKGQEYNGGITSGAEWSPDSSKFVYAGRQGARSFVVVGDQVSDAFATLGAFQPILGGGGKRVGFVGPILPSGTGVFLDGKMTAVNAKVSDLSFSPDGAHYAYTITGHLFVDGNDTGAYGTEFAGLARGNISSSDPVKALPYVFSPDGKHIAFAAYPGGDTSQIGLYLDGKVMRLAGGTTAPLDARFTPDSRHLIFFGPEHFDPRTLWIDGRPVGEFSMRMIADHTDTWEVGEDGTFTFLTPTPEGVKRIRVAMPSDTSVDTMGGGR